MINLLIFYTQIIWSHIKVYILYDIHLNIYLYNMVFHSSSLLAVPVTFSAIFDVEKTKSVEAGCPFQLQCEVTDPTAQVYWCKDGEKLLPQTGMDIQSNGTMRRLIVQSAEVFHSGLYNCETSDDTLQFTVDIKGDLWLFGSNLIQSNPRQFCGD